jgi:hypothetical protein
VHIGIYLDDSVLLALRPLKRSFLCLTRITLFLPYGNGHGLDGLAGRAEASLMMQNSVGQLGDCEGADCCAATLPRARRQKRISLTAYTTARTILFDINRIGYRLRRETVAALPALPLWERDWTRIIRTTGAPVLAVASAGEIVAWLQGQNIGGQPDLVPDRMVCEEVAQPFHSLAVDCIYDLTA